MGIARRKGLWAVAALVVGAGLFVLNSLADFDISRHNTIDHTFAVSGQTISGTLILPQDRPNPPVALIVHGDGPQDRFSGDGYLPLINTLVDAGIGVFTWDKPGVGQSTGSWLDQSMADRANEVLAAYHALRAEYGVAADRLGFLGFSQAGWVVPRVASEVTPAFTVLVGVAVDWQLQGDYYTRVRLRDEGMAEQDITAAVAAMAIDDDAKFAPGARAPDGLDPARFGFIQRNRLANATDDIATMQGPVLAIWGAQDLNVDPHANQAVYKTLFARPDLQEPMIWPDATHSLLRAGLFNTQLVEDWSPMTQALFVILGRRAYAPGALEQISTWINGHL